MTNGNYTMTQGQWKWQLHKYTTTTKNIDLETMGVYAFNGFSNGSDTVTQWQLQMKMAITELYNDNNCSGICCPNSGEADSPSLLQPNFPQVAVCGSLLQEEAVVAEPQVAIAQSEHQF